MLKHVSWIRAEEGAASPSSNFRKSVTLKQNIKKATAYVSAMGVYRFFINGCRVGDAVMTPGWTSGAYRTQYQTYDVTAMLAQSTTF